MNNPRNIIISRPSPLLTVPNFARHFTKKDVPDPASMPTLPSDICLYGLGSGRKIRSHQGITFTILASGIAPCPRQFIEDKIINHHHTSAPTSLNESKVKEQTATY